MLTPTPTSSQALGSGAVTCSITDGIATVSFYHPKSNSLPASLLSDIAGRITHTSFTTTTQTKDGVSAVIVCKVLHPFVAFHG